MDTNAQAASPAEAAARQLSSTADLSDQLLKAAFTRRWTEVESILQYAQDSGLGPPSFDVNVCAQSGLNKGSTALWMSCATGNDSICRILLKAKADVDSKSFDGCTPLYMASRNGYISCVRLCVDHDAQVDAARNDGFAPIHVCCKRGYKDTLLSLLAGGADVNLGAGDAVDNITPLFVCAQYDMPSCARVLISAGARISSLTRRGWSPLHMAAHRDSGATMRILLENGADVNLASARQTDRNDSPLSQCLFGHQSAALCTPLFLASQKGYVGNVISLVEYGADVHARCEDGLSALEVASDKGRSHVVEFLQNYDPGVSAPRKPVLLHAHERAASSDVATWALNLAKTADTGGLHRNASLLSIDTDMLQLALTRVGKMSPRVLQPGSQELALDLSEITLLLDEARVYQKPIREGTKGTFWLLQAAVVRDGRLQAAFHRDGKPQLPSLQELKQAHPEWLEQTELNVEDAARASYVHILAISHRWDTLTHPDPSGEQLHQLSTYLADAANAHIQLLFVDYCCMPQGFRTDAEEVEFKLMLTNVNMLYLGAAVLILLDRSYLSRFWTQFEGWLSFMVVSPQGLVFEDDESRQRFAIRVLHGAPQDLKTSLMTEWSGCDTTGAYRKLSAPDVTVTNQKDKEVQLPKILTLDKAMRKYADPDRNWAEKSTRSMTASPSPSRRGSSSWKARALKAEQELKKALAERDRLARQLSGPNNS